MANRSEIPLEFQKGPRLSNPLIECDIIGETTSQRVLASQANHFKQNSYQ